MTADIHIRAYTEADKTALLELLQENTPQFFSPDEEKDFIHYLDNERELYFVVEYDNKIAGCGGINFAEGRTIGRISWDILGRTHQGMGIGSRLLQHRIGILRSMEGIKTISVRTSQLAYLFYQKNGFRLIEIVKDHWAEGYDLYRMEYEKMD